MAGKEQQNPGQALVLAIVLVNAFSTPLMLSAINVALPRMAEDLALDAVATSWVPMAYLMATAMFILIFGRLADIYGRKKIFLIGTAAMAVTSLLAAFSTGSSTILAARFLQGTSAAMSSATQMAIVSSVFHPSRRGRAIGLVVSAVYFGLAAGPVLGGLITEAWGWRFNFILQIPLSLVVLVLGIVWVRQEWRLEEKPPLDVKGGVIYSLSLLLFCLGVAQLPELTGFAFLLAAVLMMREFARHSRRTAAPLWDIRLFFENRVFSFSCLASLIMYSATYANVVMVSLYLQYVLGIAPSSAGMIMMIQPITMALLSPLMGRLSDRYEPRLLASGGMLLTTAGLGLLATLGSGESIGRVVVALLLTGSGFSLFSSPNSNAIMGSVAKQHYGSASGAVATTRVLGQLFSMVVVTLSMTLFLGDARIDAENLEDLLSAVRMSFTIAAAICLPGIALSLARGRVHQPEERARSAK